MRFVYRIDRPEEPLDAVHSERVGARVESVYDFLADCDDGVYVVDRDQRIVLWNAAATRELGFAHDEVIGRPCFEVLCGRDDSGGLVCRRGCATMVAARQRVLAPTREVLVGTAGGGAARISMTTILLPSRWRALSVLAHVFCRVDDRGSRRPADIERLVDRAPREPGVPGVGAESAPRTTERLTLRERDVLTLLARGASTSTIAASLEISRTTVRTHVQHILEKLGVHTRLEAVTLDQRNGTGRIEPD